MNLNDFSDEQLQAELERRKNDEGELQKPVQLDVPDFAPLRKICLKYIDALAVNETDDDLEYYIFECAMECIYGKDVWKWINAKIE